MAQQQTRNRNRRQEAPSQETKTLVLLSTSGSPEKRVLVPKNATVTFGGLIPGAKVDGGSNRTALRVYVGKDQVAVFTGILEFRVMENVKVMQKMKRSAVKNVQVNEGGVSKMQAVHVSVEEWKDADVVEETPNEGKEMNAIKLALTTS